MVTNRKVLPSGINQEVKGIVTAERRVSDHETQMKAVQQFKERFNNNWKAQSITGLQGYWGDPMARNITVATLTPFLPKPGKGNGGA